MNHRKQHGVNNKTETKLNLRPNPRNPFNGRGGVSVGSNHIVVLARA